MLIADYTTRRVLIDNESSADILYYPAFQQMRLGRDQLRLMNSPLVGFGGMKVQPVGTITLLVGVRAYPQQISQSEFPNRRLLFFLQCHHWMTNSE